MSDTPEKDAARDAVIASIAAAFDGVGRGNGVTLHEADVIDECGSDKRRSKARKLDTESRWQDIPDADIEYHHWILAFLDAEGFRYYIPAYMTWTLKYRETDSADWTIAAFIHKAPEKDPRFALLNTAQRRAICQFLRYCREADKRMDDEFDWGQTQVALNFGWGRYCESD